MSDCCSTAGCETIAPPRLCCPRNGAEYALVAIKTVQHHLIAPWVHNIDHQGYYFCDDPDCDVVYFAEDGAILTQRELRTEVGQKSKLPERLLCYCFGVTSADYTADESIKQYVVEQTKSGTCVCEIRNPSGRCCLKNFKAS